MKKLLVSLLVILSLLVTPAAHAAGVDCADHDSSTAAKMQDNAESNKQDSNKLAKTVHHCCCNPVFSHNLMDAPPSLAVATDSTLIASEDSTLASVVVGPPLEPPSYA